MTSSLTQLIGAAALERPSPAALDVLRLIGQQDYDRSDLVRLARMDPGMVAALLRAAGKASNPGASIDRAIAVLGERAVEREIVQHALRGLRVRTVRTYGLEDFAFWRSSIATAHAAEALAEISGLDRGTMYVVGLMLDMGKLVLDGQLASDIWGRSGCGDALERDALGVDHAQVGAALARAWGLWEPVHTCIEHHHRPADTPAFEREVACAHVASWCAQWLGEPMGRDALRQSVDLDAAAALPLGDRDLSRVAVAVLEGLNSEPCVGAS